MGSNEITINLQPGMQQMSPSQLRGRQILLFYFALMIGLSVVATALHVYRQGTEQVPVRVVRIVLTVALCAWLYVGSKAARILTIVVYTFAGYSCVTLLVQVFDDWVAVAILASLAICYYSYVMILISSPSIEGFMKYQRDREAAGPRRLAG